MARRLRKHRAALIALAVYNFVLFFPVAYMGRVVSPNDIYFNYEPWKSVRPAEVQVAQNSTLNDPATGYVTLMTMVRDDWRTFHWNPYVGSGIPGFGSSAAAMLSPFILLPALAVPLAWVYTAILFLKLNASFVFAYLWLREERLGRRGAAIGAIVIAGAGVYSVRWLWQITNATALYPALLWIVRRTFNGKRTSIAVVTVIALAYALSGFPAAMAYGAWVVVAYALYLLVRALVERRRARRTVRWPGAWKLVAPLAGVVLGLVIAMPSLVPFAQLLERSGYLEVREKTSLAGVFPAAHLRSFVQPDRLGHHAYKNWLGDPRLGALNNYPESTIYLGLLTLPLLLLAIFNRRARQRWFWLACGAFILACMFGAPLLAPFVATIPGFKFSALARLVLLLPIPAGYLAAAGARLLRKPLLIYGAAAIIAFDLALLAGRFYPYLEPRIAEVPVTPMMQFVRAEKAPFRVAPFFDYFWPNTAELVRFEDVRSHFGSELAYRRMLLRLDPSAWTGSSTVLTFNSLQYKFDDPLAALLGIRWYIEQKDIDIIRWLLFSATKPAVQEISGWVPLPNGVALQRTVRVDAEPFWSIELPLRIDDAQPNARIDVALLKNGTVVWSRAFSREDATALGKVYIPVRAYARLGEQLTLRVRGSGVKAFLLEGANDVAGEARIFYGRVTIPIVFDRELPDGRLFRNVGELPRFRAVSKLRKLNDEEFLAARDVDFATEAVITDDPVMPPELGPANAQVTLASYAADEQRVRTQSDAPFFLASSEKLTPELRVTLDGRAVRAIETDSVFAGVQVPAGRHELVFSRRIARSWWWAAIAAIAIWMAIAIAEILVERRALARRRLFRSAG